MKWNNFNNTTKVDEENPYWMSFSDIMASLLVIFILAAVALILELSTKQEQLDKDMQDLQKAEAVRQDILRDIKDALMKNHIVIEIADNDTVLRIPEKTLNFPSGSYEIPSDYKFNVQEIGNVLFDVVNQKDIETNLPRYAFLDTIFIEGHTDIVPYQNIHLKGNWGLSTFRAISVWQYWLFSKQQSSQLAKIYNHAGKSLFSVSGYAETRPPECTNNDNRCIQNNLSLEEQLERSRRIDIRFTVKKPTLQEYQHIKDMNEK